MPSPCCLRGPLLALPPRFETDSNGPNPLPLTVTVELTGPESGESVSTDSIDRLAAARFHGRPVHRCQLKTQGCTPMGSYPPNLDFSSIWMRNPGQDLELSRVDRGVTGTPYHPPARGTQ